MCRIYSECVESVHPFPLLLDDDAMPSELADLFLCNELNAYFTHSNDSISHASLSIDDHITKLILSAELSVSLYIDSTQQLNLTSERV